MPTTILSKMDTARATIAPPALSVLRFWRTPLLAGGMAIAFQPSGILAQAPEANSYPVDPAAAAGMTTGLPNGMTYRQAQMMQVRASAQGAQGDAAAAAMARSAELSIEERNRQAALETARMNKAIKADMRNRLKYEHVSAAQKKVSSGEMSSWEQNGGVRVERNVPDAFILSLIEEEELAAAREGEKKKGFFGSIRAPRLPFMGGSGGSESDVAPAVASPPPSDNSEPVFATGSRSASITAAASAPSAPASKPGMVPMISGAALVDGRAPNTTAVAAADSPPASSGQVFASDRAPEPERKRSGFFPWSGSDDSDHESLVPSPGGSSGGGGFFGFGKKKSAPAGPSIDASLFPDSAVSQEPRGGRLTGGATVASVEPEASPSAAGSVELPGRTLEKPRSGFSLPKPNLSLPSLPSVPSMGRAEGGSSGATGYHVVTGTAQFMVYGAEQMQSEIRALPAGTTVMVTKPGDQWAGIRLDDGTEGVVQNKFLKAAGGGGEFADGR